ncbi:hypothetical protein ACWGET_14240 [Streptomyces zaomyceticus]
MGITRTADADARARSRASAGNDRNPAAAGAPGGSAQPLATPSRVEQHAEASDNGSVLQAAGA